MVNYQALTPPMNNSNAVVVELRQDAEGDDIRVLARSAGVHVRGVVLGYFVDEHVSSVIAGTGLTGGGSTGAITLSVSPGGISTTELSPAGSTIGQILTSTGTGVNWQTPPQGTITGVTAGTGLTGGGSSGNVSIAANFAGSGVANTMARSDHSHYVRTIVVSPVGTDSENGLALLTAVQGLTGSSATNPFLVKVEPGTYELNQTLAMHQYVDLEGSGELLTTITRGLTSESAPVILGAANSQLRFLTVESTSAGPGPSTAFAGASANMTALHARFVARGYPATAVHTTGGSLRFNHVSIASDNRGMSVSGATLLEDSEIRVGTYGGTGIESIGADGLIAKRVRIKVSGSGPFNSGIVPFSNVTLTDSQVTVTGSSRADAIAFITGIRAIELTNSFLEAVAPASYGITLNPGLGDGTSIVVENSRIVAATRTIRGEDGVTAEVGGSRLEGGPAEGPVKCAGVWDENFDFFPSTCP
jgi:hypothetical protein